ncbi:epidermal growth factor-like protein 7 [Panthera tigris]|uniref:epidermal growth factor-like protein 7 n=1 Tax=Panthera tigris TaxID=9694 RepID=UPI001C6F6947|nr:epidermal growth factor-like protein 7 [Panthera tigris]
MSTGLATGAPKGPESRLLCSECTNPSSPPVTVLSLQHLLDHLQDCLLPRPWASLRQASPCLLPWLEEDQQSPQGPWSSNMPATVAERGNCVQPGCCHRPAGWQGDTCQTDVDECSAGGGTCPPWCVNTVGSYCCQCREGHGPSADSVLCLPKRGTPRVAPNPTTGMDSAVEEEVRRLRSRVDVLEQKL